MIVDNASLSRPRIANKSGRPLMRLRRALWETATGERLWRRFPPARPRRPVARSELLAAMSGLRYSLCCLGSARRVDSLGSARFSATRRYAARIASGIAGTAQIARSLRATRSNAPSECNYLRRGGLDGCPVVHRRSLRSPGRLARLLTAPGRRPAAGRGLRDNRVNCDRITQIAYRPERLSSHRPTPTAPGSRPFWINFIAPYFLYGMASDGRPLGTYRTHRRLS